LFVAMANLFYFPETTESTVQQFLSNPS